MDDAGFVSPAERARQVAGPDASACKRNGTLLCHYHVERFARDVFGDQVSAAILIDAEVVDGNDVGMGEAAEDLGFAEKLLLEIGKSKAGGKVFEDNGSIYQGVFCFVHTTGSAGSDRAKDLVASLGHYVFSLRRTATRP